MRDLCIHYPCHVSDAGLGHVLAGRVGGVGGGGLGDQPRPRPRV